MLFRSLTYPWGVNGGLPGMRSKKIMVRTDGSEEKMPSKCDRIAVAAGDLLYFDTWGGGGCGDPLERETSKVAFDVEAGLVTVEGARRYGVVVSEDGVVDEAATSKLRAKMAKARGAVQLFDRGFTSMDELKGRCEAETTLPAPKAPEFTRRTASVKPKAKSKGKAA